MTGNLKPWWRAEAALMAVAATAVLFLIFGDRWLATDGGTGWLGLCFAWLFLMIMWGALTVVRHADALATHLGEPFGTLVLTIASISIEIFTVISVMLAGHHNTLLARDTMYSVLMIVLNGLVGVALLLGGLRHREQEVNVSGAKSYLAVLLTLAVLGLILPNYTVAAQGPALSSAQGIMLAFVALFLYGIFLWIQTGRHRDYFTVQMRADGTRIPFPNKPLEGEPTHGAAPAPYTPWVHGALLLASLLPVLVLCKKLAGLLDFAIAKSQAPDALGGLLVALLVLAPEGLSAVRAAWRNSMQRAVNILLGGALSTIGLTIPAVLCASVLAGQPLNLGLGGRETVMLVLTLLVSTITFSGRRTNVLNGAVHLVIFAAYVALIFDQAAN